MARRFFETFPTVTYDGYSCKNLLASVAIVDRYVNLPYVFYRFDIDQDQRLDTVATQYYNDPYMTWAIMFANRIKDPYYEWFLTSDDFSEFITKKYGSIESSQKKLLYFRTNWYGDTRELSPAQYNAFFGSYKAPHSNYWNPVYDESSGRLLSYVRKTIDRIVNTNKIVCVPVSNNTANGSSKLSKDDIIDIRNGSVTIGTATVERSNTSVVHLKHVLGDVANGVNLYIDNTNTCCTVTQYNSDSDMSTGAWTIHNISPEEYVYWEPVYAYDQEEENNTAKRNIRLIDSSTAIRIHDKMEEEFKS